MLLDKLEAQSTPHAWSTRDLGLASFLVCSGQECIGVDVQRDQWGRTVGFFCFASEPDAKQLASWLNCTALVEPQSLLYALRGLKNTLFRTIERIGHE